jgi:hypothetical protein
MMLHPGIKFKAIERNALVPNWYGCQIRTHQPIEGIDARSDIGRGVSSTIESLK